MQKREVYFIIGGLAVVLVGWVIQSAAGRSEAARAGSVDALLGQVESYRSAQAEAASLAEKLHVDLPKVGPAEQESQLREQLARLAQQSGVQLGALRRQERSARSAAAQAAVDFDLDLKGNYTGVIKFINALETGETPFQVAQLRVEPDSGGGGGGGGGPRRSRGGGGEQRNGNVQASLTVRGYLFPRVFEEKKPEKPKPAEAPPVQHGIPVTPSPSPTPNPETPRPQKPKETPKAATPSPTPTPTPTAEPVRPAAGIRRMRMRTPDGQEMSITIEGRTVTIVENGNTHTTQLDDEDYAKLQDGTLLDKARAQGIEIEEE